MHNNELRRSLRRFVRIIQGILPICFWVFLIYGFDAPYVAGLTVTAAVVHEGGHILYALIAVGGKSRVYGRLFGLGMRRRSDLPYSVELGLYLSGPMANLLLALLAALLSIPFGSAALDLAAINLATALSNLLPVRGYDGYGALRTFLLSRGYVYQATAILYRLSFSFTAAVCFLALYFIDRYDGGYWVFAIFAVSLLSQIGEALKSGQNELS